MKTFKVYDVGRSYSRMLEPIFAINEKVNFKDGSSYIVIADFDTLNSNFNIKRYLRKLFGDNSRYEYTLLSEKTKRKITLSEKDLLSKKSYLIF